MADERTSLRDWHRLFGLLLTDFFADSPFTVEIERDLSVQQQFLDVVVLRRGPGEMAVRPPDGLEDLVDHNLVTFKSHHEALDAWAMKELIGHHVAYRKFVSDSPSDLLPEDQFRLYAVCARFPDGLSRQVPWRQRLPGVYHCQWGTDEVRVVVAGQLSREPHNAPLHLFSASPELVGFGQNTYRRRSASTSRLMEQLVDQFQGEGFAMYTMEDFTRDWAKKQFSKLSPEERRTFLDSLPLEERLSPEELRKKVDSLPPEERLAGLTPEQIRHYLDQLTTPRPAEPRKPRRKK
jgi:hypothetical protein